MFPSRSLLGYHTRPPRLPLQPNIFTTPRTKIYLIGSLRNPRIPEIGLRLRREFPEAEIFDDWHAAGPEADDHWKTYEQGRGRTYLEALKGKAARNVYEFDKRNIDASTHVVLVLPAGKSGHLEFGYAMGQGKTGIILLDADHAEIRWDVMYQFASEVVLEEEALVQALRA